MLNQIFLYMLYLYYLFNTRCHYTHPMRRAERGTIGCCRRHMVEQVNTGELSRMGRGPVRFVRPMPTHAGRHHLWEAPVLHRTLRKQVHTRWRALASHIFIRVWEYLYRRTQHYIERRRPSADGIRLRLLVQGTKAFRVWDCGVGGPL
jgi:hypothetical protein